MPVLTNSVISPHHAHTGQSRQFRNTPEPCNGWSPLFKSYQDCIVHYANGMRGAAEVGSTIGAGLVIVLWVAADVILGIGRLIVVLARRTG